MKSIEWKYLTTIKRETLCKINKKLSRLFCFGSNSKFSASACVFFLSIKRRKDNIYKMKVFCQFKVRTRQKNILDKYTFI